MATDKQISGNEADDVLDDLLEHADSNSLLFKVTNHLKAAT